MKNKPAPPFVAALLRIALSLFLAALPARAALLGYWTFDNNYNDLSPANRPAAAGPGTQAPVFSTDVPSQLAGRTDSRSLDMRTSNRYAEVPGSEAAYNPYHATNNPTSSFTVSCWVKGWPTASWVPFVSKNGEAGGWQVRRNGASTNLDWTTRGSSTGFSQGNGDFNTGTIVANGGLTSPGTRNTQWYHYVCTFDGTNKNIYLNGQLVSQQANPGARILDSTTRRLVFGARHEDGGTIGSFSLITLDEVAIWDNALTQVQIADLFSGTDPRYLHAVATPWNLGEPWGTTGKWGVKEAKTSNAAWQINNLNTACGVLMNSAGFTSQAFSVIDFKDPNQPGGGSATAATYLSNTAADDEDFAMIATCCIRVPSAGPYTFSFNGDDGFQAVILGGAWTGINTQNGNATFSGEFLNNMVPTGDTNTYAVATLVAGDYNFRYIWYERGGGAFNRIRISAGNKANDDGTFKLLGDATGPVTLVDQVPMLHSFTSSDYLVTNTPSLTPPTITLSWDTKYASSLSITPPLPGSPAITPGVNSVTFASPTTTTTYTLTGTTGAQVRTRDLTVFVDQPPVINSFTLTDSTLATGAPMTLNWNAIGASSLSIDQGIGSVTPTGTGSLNLPAPATATTYTLTATNAFGSVTAQTTVTIGPPPVINSFTVSDSQVEPNQQVQFAYNTTDATTVTLSPNTSGTATPPGSGTVNERISSTRTYTLTASSDFGVTTSQLTVNVAQYISTSAANWTITLYKSATALMNTLADAQGLIDGTIARGNVTVGVTSTPTPITISNQPVVNLTDSPAADGVMSGGTWPTASFGTAAIEDFVIRATATLVIASPGEYVLNINNDDGGRLRIDFNQDGDFDDAGEAVIIDDVLSGPHTVSTPVDLDAGSFGIEYVYFERSGGAEGEVFFTNSSLQNFLLTSAGAAPPITFGDLRINEFMASNNLGLRDTFGNREDWIEIYNGTGAARSMAGYYLTNDPLLLNKWAFPVSPAHTLPDGGYLVLFASNKNTTLPGPEYHTNFKLTAAGSYLALTKDDGMGGYTIVQQFSPAFPAQATDISYGEYDSEHYTGYFSDPTPGGRNGGGYDFVVVGETHLALTQGGNPITKERGFYDAPIVATLTQDDPVATLRYTLDGSTPSINNGTDYTTPLTISSTTVLRSASVRAGANSSPVDTHSFIFVDDVITQTTATATSKGWPAAPVNGQLFDYDMSSSVVSPNQAAVKAALLAIPTISIVTDMSNLTHPSSGIYVNPGQRGRIWERPCSIELLNDDGLGGGQFQHDSGLRIRGGFSRSTANPKHAWHFYFRNEYDGDLNYPMFGAEGADDFEQLDLQCPQNYSWSFSPQNNTFSYTAPGNIATTLRLRYNTFVREPLSRDLFNAMGQPYGRTRHYHCYVNGHYWGIYMSQERPEASFGETYLGGDKDNYDVVKSAGNAAGYNTEATDGTFAQGTSATPGSAWARLWWRTNEMRNPAGQTEATRRTSYFELMGRDATGAPYNDPVAHPIVLDDDNLVDYMIITWFCGSFDAPLSTFLPGASNNWFGLRDRLGNRGFISFPHDFEHGMGTDLQTGNERSLDRTGPWGGSGTNYKGQTMYNQLATYAKSNPEYFHENLASCLEYRVKFWDRAHRHLTRPGGALTTPAVLAKIDARAAVVRTAILAESARWGDAKGVGSVDFMPSAWDESITQLKGWVQQGSNAEYLASIPTQANPAGTPGLGRANRLVVQLRAYQDKVNLTDAANTALPLYSPLNTPTFSNYGGVVANNTPLTITDPNAGTTLYWTLDGSDPRLIGGAVSGTAQTGTSPATFNLTVTGRIQSRAYNAATQTWSALETADFIVGTPADASSLVITEINYNPRIGAPGTPTAGDIQTFEFIELQNVSAATIDLTNVSFTNGISYTFPTGRLLAAGERVVVAHDPVAFATRYPDAGYPGLSAKTVGPWTGALQNGGERLVLTGVDGADAGTDPDIIADFSYDDDAPWPLEADGNGKTIWFICSNPVTADKNLGTNWFEHSLLHGNPGGVDCGYDLWALNNGGSANGQADNDLDGLEDLVEYMLGTSITASSADEAPTAGTQDVTVGMDPPAQYATITFTQAPLTPDVQVFAETATALTGWNADAVLVSETVNGDGSVTRVYRAPVPFATDARRQLRIRVVKP